MINLCLCVCIGIVNYVNTNGQNKRDQKFTMVVMMMKLLKCMSTQTQCIDASIDRSVNDF